MSNGYTCQRCHQPLILDPSINNATNEQKRSLIDQTSSIPTSSSPRDLSKVPGSQEARTAYVQAQSHERLRKARVGPAESFILLSQSTIGGAGYSGHGDGATRNAQSPSSSTIGVDYLLEKLSSTTGIDHPLCTTCASLLQSLLQEKLEDVQRERDAYLSFEKDWQSKREEKRQARSKEGGEGAVKTDEEEYEEMRRERDRLEGEEEEFLRELERVEEEEEGLEKEWKEVEEEDEQLKKEEIQFLEERQLLQSQISKLESQLRTSTTLHLLSTQTLRRLESTNVYNDVFQIGHVPIGDTHHPSSSSNRNTNTGGAGGTAGENWSNSVPSGTSQTVGTINGLRLGGRPWVDWVEINAALGLVALCMHRIAEKIGLTFETYKIVPMGSFSRIEELPPSKNHYELYASTELSAARLLQNRRFNYALLGMLDCLRQIINYGKTLKKGWATAGLDITKDKIAGHPIKLSANMGMSSLGIVGNVPGSSVLQSTEAEESWTKSLRAVLAVLKRILIVESETDSGALA